MERGTYETGQELLRGSWAVSAMAHYLNKVVEYVTVKAADMERERIAKMLDGLHYTEAAAAVRNSVKD